MNRDAIGDAEREERLNGVLLNYVEALEAGREADRDRLLAAHPDLRGDLEAFFASHDAMERLAAPLREANIRAKPPEAASSQESSAGLGQLGDFRLMAEVGRGGMGIVYEAEQLSLRRRVALKVLSFAAALDPRRLQRFQNEALATAQLRHESIVPVYGVGCERGVHYYAMQFIEGRSLASLIAELRREQDDKTARTSLSPPAAETHPAEGAQRTAASQSRDRSPGSRRYFAWAAGLIRKAAVALEYAHQVGVVHRDVKPANLLLDERGQIWVADFGLAQIAGDAGLTQTGELLGTLRYSSPEQALGRPGVMDHRSDVYSLGATLYELLTLRPIFEGRDRKELLRQIAENEPRSPRAAVAAIPAELETIVLKALRKEPSERYRSAQELADDLQRFLDDRPILARRPTVTERAWKWARRRPSIVAAGIVILLLLAVGSFVSAALLHAEQERTKQEKRNAEDAYRRERQRAEEAESRLRLARRSVDELIQVSEEELADRPGMEPVRKRLLRSALAFYQEIIEQRRDDRDAQAELVDTTQRVEKILADLAVLQAAGKLYLLGQTAVHDDLGLDDGQRKKVKELTARLGKRWMESFNDLAPLSPAERGRRVVEQARADEAEVNAILTGAQQDRLRQIGLQADGPGAFRDPETAARLQLTAEQRERIRAIEDDAFFSWMRMAGPHPGGGPDPAKDRPANERILEALTAEQVTRWKQLTGEPFKGSLMPAPPPFGPPPPAPPPH
ncbi:MAG TPA: serine/threonine-protein kinase [Gemmataceae bacterium]|nr:serine/threonine-protein kinase [Gemmataceae bacterium]